MKKLSSLRPLFAVLVVTLTLLGGSVVAWSVERASSEPSAAASVGVVNINTASAEQLAASLSGVGKARAQAIVEYRQQHGLFTDKNQLLNVKGIAEATLTKNSAVIVLE
tara:strand:- start:6297 stop:6623 length:327 start_codon:yes stop_codon:yes gene_type:complete